MSAGVSGCTGDERERDARIGILRRFLPRAAERGSNDLRTSLRCSDIGPHGPLITGLFSRLRDIRGSFNVDDCGHFHLLLSMQSAFGIRGNLLEIGSFYGRATTMMAAYLTEGESIHVCDAFKLLEPRHPAGAKPTPAELLSNILSVNRELARDRIVIYECMSGDLRLDPDLTFRFVHIDGGHSTEQTLLDLALATRHLVTKGVIVVDDYHHPDWPGVAPAVDTFLGRTDGLSMLADLNRHGAQGRKAYLIKN